MVKISDMSNERTRVKQGFTLFFEENFLLSIVPHQNRCSLAYIETFLDALHRDMDEMICHLYCFSQHSSSFISYRELFFTCSFVSGCGVNHDRRTSYHKASAVRIILPTLYAERIFSKIIRDLCHIWIQQLSCSYKNKNS